jgi:hypothetical protein
MSHALVQQLHSYGQVQIAAFSTFLSPSYNFRNKITTYMKYKSIKHFMSKYEGGNQLLMKPKFLCNQPQTLFEYDPCSKPPCY